MNYSTVLTRCMLVSFIGMTAGVFIPPNPEIPLLPLLLPFLVGVAPLIWYHVGYLQQRDEIGSTEIDSVYYYGFLVTIGALGCTALRLSLNGVDGDFAGVALQFGLGLLATGYAVWARVQLTARSNTPTESELLEQMQRSVENARQLGDAIDLGVSQYTAFAKRVVEGQEAFGLRIQGVAEENINQATLEFRAAMAGIAEEGRLALQELRAAVNDVTFREEREELHTSIRDMTKTVTALTSTLKRLQASALTGSESTGRFADELSRVEGAALLASGALANLGYEDGSVAKLNEAIEQSRHGLAELNLSAGMTTVSFTSVSDSASGSVAPLNSLTTHASATVGALQKIGDFGPRLIGLADALNTLEERVGRVSAYTDSSGAAFESMGKQVDELRAVLVNLNEALIDSTGGFKDAMFTLSDEIEGRLTSKLVAIEEQSRRLDGKVASKVEAQV